MNASDLRPNSAEHDAAPMENGKGQQLEHLFEPRAMRPVYDNIETLGGTERVLIGYEPEPELLTKVLPAGGPLVSQPWHCSGCRTTFKEGKPAACPGDYPLHMCQANGGSL